MPDKREDKVAQIRKLEAELRHMRGRLDNVHTKLNNLQRSIEWREIKKNRLESEVLLEAPASIPSQHMVGC